MADAGKDARLRVEVQDVPLKFCQEVTKTPDATNSHHTLLKVERRWKLTQLLIGQSFIVMSIAQFFTQKICVLIQLMLTKTNKNNKTSVERNGSNISHFSDHLPCLESKPGNKY